MTTVFDDTPCTLGEGALWHPMREQLFWFDILGNRLLTRTDAGGRDWLFTEHVSAAGWADRDTLLIASETGLSTFDIPAGRRTSLVALEADNPKTRSNDGRADPWGGFWISTMGTNAEPGAGAIYRYFRGEVRRLFRPLTIPNAICFTHDRRFAHFADTSTRKIYRVELAEPDGWPAGAPTLFLDLSAEGLNPDGAVIDSEGRLWVALWGAGRVSAFDPTGRHLRSVSFPAPQTTCPAFGGPGLSTLFCTSARKNMYAATLAMHPRSGMTFAAPHTSPGRPEYRIVL